MKPRMRRLARRRVRGNVVQACRAVTPDGTVRHRLAGRDGGFIFKIEEIVRFRWCG